MSKENNLTDYLTDLADGIRLKKGIEGNIDPQNFRAEIESIKTEAKLEEREVRYTSNGKREVERSADKDGISKITIEVAVPTNGSTDYKIQTKTVEVTENNKVTEVYPDRDYDYMDEVIVTTNIPMQDKSVTYNDNVSGAVIEADRDYGGLSKITVNVDVPMQEIQTQDITTAESTPITPMSGYKAMKKVVVTPVLDSKTEPIKTNGTYVFTPKDGTCGLSNVTVNVDVPTSGGGESVVVKEPEPKDVNFYDYDGTLLYSYTTAEASVLTELPPVPSAPEGLDLQSDSGTWNYTLDEIKDIGGMCDVGAMYTSSNPYVTLVIETPYDGFSARFMIKSSLGNADVNWGDGLSNTVGGQDSSFTHTYDKAGRYTISYRCQNANATVTLGTQTNYTICGDKTNTSTYDYVGTSCLVGVIIGEKCGIQTTGYSFAYSGLRFCILSSKVKSIPQYTFQYCSQLKHITLPKSCNLGGNAFAYSGLKTISLGPEGGAGVAMGSNLFSSALGLRRIVIPRHTSSELTLGNFANTHGLTTMVIRSGWSFTGTQTFRSLNLLDLSDYDTVPSLGSTLTLPASCKILVKSGLKSEFQSKTNWSSHSSKFVEV